MNEEYSSAHLKLQKKTRWIRQASIKKGKVAPLLQTRQTTAGRSKTNEKTNNEVPIETKVNEKTENDGFTMSKWISFFFRVDFPLFITADAMKEYQMYNYLNVNPIVFSPAISVYLVLIVMSSGLIALNGKKCSIISPLSSSFIIIYLMYSNLSLTCLTLLLQVILMDWMMKSILLSLLVPP